MAEIRPKMYDLLHPNPISLQDLSAIVISQEIWRCEVNKCRQNGSLRDFYPKQRNLSLNSIIPNLPSVICNLVDEYIPKFGASLYRWVRGHFDSVFYFQYGHQNDVLEDFDDFVPDFDGGIHSARTAERIMYCDRFNMDVKFVTACEYHLEEDIRQFWPFVSRKVKSSDPDYPKTMQLYYWVCTLRNKFHKLPTSRNGSVDEEMFEACAYHRPSLDYFWNRLPPASRLHSAIKHSKLDRRLFLRFILPKLDDKLLDEFVNKRGNALIRGLVNSLNADERLTLTAWMYIRNVMSESTFTNLIVDILKTETYLLVPHSGIIPSTWLNLCSQIWNNSPDNLKKAAITRISFDPTLILCNLHDELGMFDDTTPDFLLVVLSYASAEERRQFWINCWKNLTLAYNLDNMQKILKACLEDEQEITEFRVKVIAQCQNVLNEYS